MPRSGSSAPGPRSDRTETSSEGVVRALRFRSCDVFRCCQKRSKKLNVPFSRIRFTIASLKHNAYAFACVAGCYRLCLIRSPRRVIRSPRRDVFHLYGFSKIQPPNIASCLSCPSPCAHLLTHLAVLRRSFSAEVEFVISRIKSVQCFKRADRPCRRRAILV